MRVSQGYALRKNQCSLDLVQSHLCGIKRHHIQRHMGREKFLRSLHIPRECRGKPPKKSYTLSSSAAAREIAAGVSRELSVGGRVYRDSRNNVVSILKSFKFSDLIAPSTFVPGGAGLEGLEAVPGSR